MKKKIFKSRRISVIQLMNEIEELEPKNIIDYIFKGSGLHQWLSKNILPEKPFSGQL